MSKHPVLYNPDGWRSLLKHSAADLHGIQEVNEKGWALEMAALFVTEPRLEKVSLGKINPSLFVIGICAFIWLLSAFDTSSHKVWNSVRH